MAEKNSATVPWSVKGVSKRARQLAKEQASRQGITIGEWLTDRILRYARVDFKETTNAMPEPPRMAEASSASKATVTSIAAKKSSDDAEALQRMQELSSELEQLKKALNQG